jgi:hypothetical protein
MSTISQELEACKSSNDERLKHSIAKRCLEQVEQTLSSHQELLKLQQKQVECLTQLLIACRNSSLDNHCSSAIDRLTELLDRHQQDHSQVYNVLSTLQQAKDANNLTIDAQGKVVTYLKLELDEVAQRLKIEPPTKLSKAANHLTDWSKLMTAHPDPDGYQWQCPNVKRGFFHKTHLQVTGTKTVELESRTSLN